METRRFRVPPADARVYLLATTSATRLPLVAAVEAAIRGGVDMVQLREKELGDEDFTALARALLVVCRAHRVPFIVNDRVDVARAVQADGVHLGQDDAPVAAARVALPPGSIVGVSTHGPGELERALADGADYVGVGALHATTTKTTPVEVSGPDALGPLARSAEARGVPAFGIGGVTLERLPGIVAAGFTRVAVCAGILRTADPEAAARAIRAGLPGLTPRGERSSTDGR